MAETAAAPAKPKSTRRASADKDAIAQVEKWMAIIREVNREQPKS
jgi:hypothetical protein